MSGWVKHNDGLEFVLAKLELFVLCQSWVLLHELA